MQVNYDLHGFFLVVSKEKGGEIRGFPKQRFLTVYYLFAEFLGIRTSRPR